MEVATSLKITTEMARERGWRIGVPAPQRRGPSRREDPSRPPLPAGHPRAWGLLTADTLLADTPWPGWM